MNSSDVSMDGAGFGWAEHTSGQNRSVKSEWQYVENECNFESAEDSASSASPETPTKRRMSKNQSFK